PGSTYHGARNRVHRSIWPDCLTIRLNEGGHLIVGARPRATRNQPLHVSKNTRENQCVARIVAEVAPGLTHSRLRHSYAATVRTKGQPRDRPRPSRQTSRSRGEARC